MGCGMDDYLQKPLTREQLNEKVELWLGQKVINPNTSLGNVVEPDRNGETLNIEVLQAFYGDA